jgi:hypothetical protein
MPVVDVDVLFIVELFWSSGDQCLFFVNQTGDAIGNASGRKRSMGTTLKNRYVSLRLQPANF